MNEDKLTELLQATERLEQIQSQAERKIKDAKAYRENNLVLFKLLISLIITFGVCMVITVMSIAVSVCKVSRSYFDHEKSIMTEIEFGKEEIDVEGNGTIINDSITEGSVFIGE